MLKCIELDEKLKSMDQEITVNPQFVQKVVTVLLKSGTGSNEEVWKLPYSKSQPMISASHCVLSLRVWERKRMTSAARRQATPEEIGWITA